MVSLKKIVIKGMKEMVKYEEIKRKHARFPAYADDAGVKLQPKNNRPTFKSDDNWIITEAAKHPQPVESTAERALRRSPRVSQGKAGQSIRQKEELSKHRKNLPDYNKRYQPEVTPTGKKRLFGDTVAHSTYQVTEKRTETTRPTITKEPVEKSPFVPKYIPASIIPDEHTSAVSEEELMESMEKEEYMLFDTEPAAYQARKDSDPAVRKFNSNPSVKMTRSQYRANSKKK
ncbi:hypothetical protein RV16_GL002232 [Enterococcus saccharolyticus]|nr:hypothetical protein RV16_GL002232 [Enterococcus saccharolyticus]